VSQEDYNKRKFDADHDILLKISANVERLLSEFQLHEKKDDDRFSTVHERINVLSKGVYVGMGIFILANIFLLPILMNYLNR